MVNNTIKRKFKKQPLNLDKPAPKQDVVKGTTSGTLDKTAIQRARELEEKERQRRQAEEQARFDRGELPEGFKIDVGNDEPQAAPVVEEPTKVTDSTGGVIITDSEGNERLQTPQDVEREKAIAETGGASASQAVAANELRAQQIAEGQALGGQVGQFDQLGVNPTGFDVKESLISAAIGSIPRAIQFAAGGALLGGGTTGPVGAAIGAAGGFGAGMVTGVSSNFAAQRRDVTTAQQRVLDEGKQNLQAIVNNIKADPSNKTQYLAAYNQQSAIINQAYRQMKLDTSRDVAKFETALPNLAEFEVFYGANGERDILDAEMKIALATPADPTFNYLKQAQEQGLLNE